MSSIRKLFDKYKDMSLPLKAGLWFVVSNILLRGISFITLPIFARLLSTEDMGVVTLYNSWITLLSMVVALNVWTGGFNVGLTKFEDQTDGFVSSAQGLGITISLLFLGLSVVGLDLVSDWLGLSKTVSIFIFLQILFMVPVNIWTQKKRFDYSYKEVVVVSLIMAVVNPILGYFLVINMSDRGYARILSFFIIEVILGVFCFALNLRKKRCIVNREHWKYLFSFNLALLPHYISAQILNQSDRVMISKMCGTSYAGIYGVAYNFAMLMTLVTAGIETVVTPYTFKSLKAGKTNELKKMVVFSMSVIAIGAVFLMCMIPDVFRFMLPESYYEAVYIIPIVVAAAYFQFLYPIFSNVELYYNEKRFVTLASCVGAVVNIVLNYVFIQIFGYIAAAYTTLFCYILFCVFHYLFMCRVLKKNKAENVYDIKSIVTISAILVVATFGILALYSNFYVRYGVMIVLLLALLANRKRVVELMKMYFKR